MRASRLIFFLLLGLLAALGLFAVLITATPTGGIEGPAAAAGRSGPTNSTAARQVYSPRIASDPYVIDQWEKSVQALESACRDRGEYCEQARAARRSINR